MKAIDIEPTSRPDVNPARTHNESMEMETSILMSFLNSSDKIRIVIGAMGLKAFSKVFRIE